MNYNRGYSRRQPMGYCSDRDVCGVPYNVPRGRMDTRCDEQENTANAMNYKLAMVYSPIQEWQNIYSGEKALENGTIFAELNKPFYGYKNNKGGCCL